MAGAFDITSDEDNSDEIKKAFNVFDEGIFAFTVFSRAVMNYNFADVVVLFGDDNRYETIEFAVKVETLENGTAISFKATIGVVNFDVGE